MMMATFGELMVEAGVVVVVLAEGGTVLAAVVDWGSED